MGLESCMRRGLGVWPAVSHEHFPLLVFYIKPQVPERAFTALQPEVCFLNTHAESGLHFNMLLAVAVLCSVVLWTHSFNSSDVQPQTDFDLERFTGEWYRVGFAYDHPLVIKYKSKMLITRGLLLANENEGANLTMWSMNSQKTCNVTSYVYEKTEFPGAFTYFSQRHKIVKDITVLETNYTDYGVVLKYKNMNKEYTQLALYGRKSELRPEVVEHFRSLALTIGFSAEAIVTPAIVDPCPLPEPSNMTELLD